MMRTIGSFVSVLAVTFAVASSGSATSLKTASLQPVSDYLSPSGQHYFYADGQFQPTYPRTDRQATSQVKDYFYADGQFHPSYETLSPTREASNGPTGRFYYDGQFHETFS